MVGALCTVAGRAVGIGLSACWRMICSAAHMRVSWLGNAA